MFLLAVVVGLLVGKILGGRLRGLGGLSIRWPFVPFVALVAVVTLTKSSLDPTSPLSRSLIAVSYLVVAAWLVRNVVDRPPALRAGFEVVLLGWLLNALVVIANGRMPASLRAMRSAGIDQKQLLDSSLLFRHEVADRHSLLPWLADVIPARPLGAVISIGDIVFLAGIAGVIAAGMQSGQATPTPDH